MDKPVNNTLILKTPASWWGNMWREALPAGNGKIGASVYGGVHKETVLLNHGELWHGGKRDALPDVSYTLEEVRQLMDQGKYREADNVLTDKLREEGYDPRVASVLPFGDLIIEMPNQAGFKKYRRYLDMETGEVTVKWEDGRTRYQRSLFVSRADDLVVYEIYADDHPFDAWLTLSVHDPRDSKYVLQDEGFFKSVKVKVEGEYVYYSAVNDDGTDFGAVMRVISHGGELNRQGDSLDVRGSRKVLALIKLFVKGEQERDWTLLTQELGSISANYRDLLHAHSRIHSPLFNTASITLSGGDDRRSNEELLLEAYEGEPSNSLIEKMWAYGRYLLISSSSEDGLPCALYGLWCGDYNPIWCQHVANENVEMIYSHASVGGLSQVSHALFNYYDSLMKDSRENASKLFGCRGILIHAYTTPGLGLASVLVPVITNWTGAAGWLARFYYDYYLYTGDIEFLKERALPFMREAAMFYEDFLVTGEGGYLKIYPSVSPENSPGHFWNNDNAMTHPMPTTINATMEFAILKELLSNLIYASLVTGEYAEEVVKWENMLRRIPPYQVNDDGSVREWMHEDFDEHHNHRHMSHIYPIFPGTEISRENEPELFEAFAAAVRKRLIIGLNEQSGWSLGHMASIYARMEDGDSALECLELLSRSCLMNNFLTLHNDWRNMGITVDVMESTFQIDANMCWTNAVQEMLLYSSPELVKILPACPNKWKKGNVKGLRYCYGSISFSWNKDEGLFSCEINADRDNDMKVKLPGEFGSYRVTIGSEVDVAQTENTIFRLQMKAGSRLVVNAK